MKIVKCVCANESGHVSMQSYEEIPDEIVDAIMSFEAGDLDQELTVSLFQKLIDTNLAWQLQGSYSRIAMQLIDAGLCAVKEKKAA